MANVPLLLGGGAALAAALMYLRKQKPEKRDPLVLVPKGLVENYDLRYLPPSALACMLPHTAMLDDAARYAHQFAMSPNIHYVPITEYARDWKIPRIDGQAYSVADLASVEPMNYNAPEFYVRKGLIPSIRTSLPGAIEQHTDEWLEEAFRSGKLKFADFWNGRLGEQVLKMGQGPGTPWAWQHMHWPLRDPNSNAFVNVMRSEANQRPNLKGAVMPLLKMWEGLNPDFDHFAWATHPADYGITIFPPVQWDSNEQRRLWAYNYHHMMDRSDHGVAYALFAYSRGSHRKVPGFFAQWHRRFSTKPLYPVNRERRHYLGIATSPDRPQVTDPIDPFEISTVAHACWYNAVAFAGLGFLPTVPGMTNPFTGDATAARIWKALRNKMKRSKVQEHGYTLPISMQTDNVEGMSYGIIRGAVGGAMGGPIGIIGGAMVGAAMGILNEFMGSPSPGDYPDITWWHPEWIPVPYPLAQIGTKAGLWKMPRAVRVAYEAGSHEVTREAYA